MADSKGEMITLRGFDKQNPGYLTVPQGEGPWPGVVVIQEWWGLNDHIKDVADRLAAEGFVALAPDLYGGVVVTEPDDARKLRMALVWSDALAIIQSAVDLLVEHDQVLSSSIGVVGFCMGGGLAWHAAAKLKHVGAAVPFYGGGPELSDEEVAEITAPVLAIFGELDKGVSPEVARKRAAQMDAAGVRHETIIYPGAGHAFFNDTRAAYHAAAATDAWRRMLELFRRRLSNIEDS
jgi:carboxymethylenebutenolidase